MTRETKIGLLVGLAFIIVIGILLSDHLTAATEQPQAALVQAGENVRSAIAVPGGASTPIAQVHVPQQVAPDAPVVTREEMMHKPPQVTVVQVGPANSGQPVTAPRQTQQAANSPAPEQPIAGNTAIDSNAPPEPRRADASKQSSLEQVANEMQEPVVPVDQKPAAQPPQLAATGQKQYQAQPGDTVSRMAARFLGANTKTNRDLIINANASLKDDPDKVIVGKSYIIPTATNTTVAHSVPKLADKVVVVDDPRASARPAAPASAEHIYVVKPGDTLTKIAVEQLGTADAVSAIVELNKLPDANHIRVNMKLRLPAKPISVADSQ